MIALCFTIILEICINIGMIQFIFTIIHKIAITVETTGSYHLAHHPPITYLPSTGGHLCSEQLF